MVFRDPPAGRVAPVTLRGFLPVTGRSSSSVANVTRVAEPRFFQEKRSVAGAPPFRGNITPVNEPAAYDRDPYLRQLTTKSVASGRDERGFWVAFADTIFYPEGGGQPADRGTVAGIPVRDVQKVGGVVRHYLDREPPAGEVLLELDWERRYDHMQQHTGQHLLSAIAEDRFGWKTTAFHLGSEVCDVELEVKALSPEQLAALEEEVARDIRAARPVRVHRIPPEELAAIPKLRSRGLPEGHQGLVRLVAIEGVDTATCGGTHLQNTAEIEALALLATEPMRGGTRVYFVAGGRLRRRLHAHEARNAALRKLLGASDGELAAVVEAKLAELSELGRRLRRAQEELASLVGDQLARRHEAVVTLHREDADLSFLNRMARAFLDARPEGVLLATAGREPEGTFLLAAARPDLKVLGEVVAQELEGRGGGSGSVFQGKAAKPSRREEAKRKLEDLLGGSA